MQTLPNTLNSTALRPALKESSTTYSAANVTWISQRIQAGELSKPGPELDDFTRKLLVGLWLETLAEIGPERFDAAFKHVLLSNTFRPDIAEIRKAAGINRGIQDPTEQKAMSALREIFAIMRTEHGPEMKTLDGKILKTHNENGDMLKDPVRAPSVPASTLEARTEAAIVELGLGSRVAGLELIAGHPAINKDVDPSFRVKTAMDVERLWIRAYAGVR